MVKKKKGLTKTLKHLVGELEDKFGPDNAKKLLEEYEKLHSWGSPALDTVLGGLPNRIVELYGKEGAGKSTIALKTIAEAQKKGQNCAYLDVENSFSREYAEQLGVDVDKLIVRQEHVMEEVLEIIVMLIQSPEMDIIVLDSFPALQPKDLEDAYTIEQDVAKEIVAKRAKMMNNILNTITAQCSKNGVSIIIINQIRDKMKSFGFGKQTSTPGGHALKHYAFQRVEVIPAKRIKKTLKGIEYVVGRELIVVAEKNKVAIPLVQCKIPLIFGRGLQDTKAEYHRLSKEDLDKIYNEEVK